MAGITTRNVLNEVLTKVVAASNRRSREEQALADREQAAVFDKSDPLDRAATIRGKLEGPRRP